MNPEEYLGPYVITNVVSAGFLVAALARPRAARILFVILFVAASLFNAWTALSRPEVYLDYGEMAVLEFYRDFINGPFSEHTRAIVLAIALAQMIIGVMLACSGRWRRTGVIGGVVFFLAIAPLGIGSAFPSPVILAAALILMERGLSISSEKGAAPSQS